MGATGANRVLNYPDDYARLKPSNTSTQTDILQRWLMRRRQVLLMELAEIEDVLELPRTKPARNR